MTPYNKANKPERDWRASRNTKEKATWLGELAEIREYLAHFARTRELRLNPPLPSGVLRRAADNIRGLCSIADAAWAATGRGAPASR